jgi:hypothetical protein
MLGVPRELIEHSLNVHPQAVPKNNAFEDLLMTSVKQLNGK